MGWGSGIQRKPTTDPGIQKSPDPGSGSETLWRGNTLYMASSNFCCRLILDQKDDSKKSLGLFQIIPCMVDSLTFYGCTLGLKGTTVGTTSLQGGHLRYRVLHTKQPILTSRFTQDGGGLFCCMFWSGKPRFGLN
jgi:hypothetical protein